MKIIVQKTDERIKENDVLQGLNRVHKEWG